MVRVIVEDNFEQALKLFRRLTVESGLTREMRQRRYYVAPAERRRRKALLARKRRSRRG